VEPTAHPPGVESVESVEGVEGAESVESVECDKPSPEPAPVPVPVPDGRSKLHDSPPLVLWSGRPGCNSTHPSIANWLLRIANLPLPGRPPPNAQYPMVRIRIPQFVIRNEYAGRRPALQESLKTKSPGRLQGSGTTSNSPVRRPSSGSTLTSTSWTPGPPAINAIFTASAISCPCSTFRSGSTTICRSTASLGPT